MFSIRKIFKQHLYYEFSPTKQLRVKLIEQPGQWMPDHEWQAVINSRRNGEQFFYDFRPYSPSADAPASFIGQAIRDAAGEVIGSVVFQMPIERINGIMQNADGTLPPIAGRTTYNHLSVRSAASVIVDRLLGSREE